MSKTIQERLREFDDGPAGRGWKLCHEAADIIDGLNSSIQDVEAIRADEREKCIRVVEPPIDCGCSACAIRREIVKRLR